MNVVELDEYKHARKSRPRLHRNSVRPHDPADRILIGRITASLSTPMFSTWEIRAFDRTGPFHLYFSTREMLHLQLWNPYYGLSVLTPSKITGHLFEAFPLFDWKLTSKSYAEINRGISTRFATILPTLSEVNTFAKDYYDVKEAEAIQIPVPTRGAV